MLHFGLIDETEKLETRFQHATCTSFMSLLEILPPEVCRNWPTSFVVGRLEELEEAEE